MVCKAKLIFKTHFGKYEVNILLNCLNTPYYTHTHTHTHTYTPHTRMPEEPPFVKHISKRSSLNKPRLWVRYNISGDRKKGFQLSKFMDPDSPSVA